LALALSEQETFPRNLWFNPSEVDWQERVDQLLKILAKKMDEVFEEEERRRKPLPVWAGRLGRVPLYVDDYKEASRSAKQGFWAAHELASKLGFVTRPSYKEYLPIIAESRS
jgi:hypothetical protein